MMTILQCHDVAVYGTYSNSSTTIDFTNEVMRQWLMNSICMKHYLDRNNDDWCDLPSWRSMKRGKVTNTNFIT